MGYSFVNTGGYFDHGSGSTLDNLSDCTVIFVGRPRSTGGSGTRILSKRSGAAIFQVVVGNPGGGNGKLVYEKVRATTSTLVETITDTYRAGDLIAFAFTDSPSVAPRCFLSKNGSPLYEAAYTTQQTGVGSPSNESAAEMAIGSRAGANPGCDWDLFYAWVYNRRLDRTEIERHFQDPENFVTTGCVLRSQLGKNGTNTVHDLSGNGNHGSLVGTVPWCAHHPTFGTKPWLISPMYEWAGDVPPATLVGAGRCRSVAAATITGTGALAGVCVARAEGSAPLTGTGALVGATTGKARGQAVVLGTGALLGAGKGDARAAALLAGSGALSGTTYGRAVGNATGTGTGALVGAGRASSVGTALLEVLTSVTLVGVCRSRGQATITGTGALTGAARSAARGASGGVALAIISGACASRSRGSASASLGYILIGATIGRSRGAGVVIGTGSLAAAGISRVRATASLGGTAPIFGASVSRVRGASTYLAIGALAGVSMCRSAAAATFPFAWLVGVGVSRPVAASALSGVATITGTTYGRSIGQGTVTDKVPVAITYPVALFLRGHLRMDLRPRNKVMNRPRNVIRAGTTP